MNVQRKRFVVFLKPHGPWCWFSDCLFVLIKSYSGLLAAALLFPMDCGKEIESGT